MAESRERDAALLKTVSEHEASRDEEIKSRVEELEKRWKEEDEGETQDEVEEKEPGRKKVCVVNNKRGPTSNKKNAFSANPQIFENQSTAKSTNIFFTHTTFVSGKCHVVHSPNRAPQHHHPTGGF